MNSVSTAPSSTITAALVDCQVGWVGVWPSAVCCVTHHQSRPVPVAAPASHAEAGGRVCIGVASPVSGSLYRYLHLHLHL
jgi:hypothetical protein